MIITGMEGIGAKEIAEELARHMDVKFQPLECVTEEFIYIIRREKDVAELFSEGMSKSAAKRARKKHMDEAMKSKPYIVSYESYRENPQKIRTRIKHKFGI